MAGEQGKLEQYGWRAMATWLDKRPMTRCQSLLVGLWLVQGKALAWRFLPAFVWRRGKVKVREWYDD